MNNVKEIIDRLKAIDGNKTFLKSCKDSFLYSGYRENWLALKEALMLDDSLCSYQEDINRMRNRIVELLEEAQASQEPQLPEGIEWPRTEDGRMIDFRARGLLAVWDKGYGNWLPTSVEFKHDGKVVIHASTVDHDVDTITLRRGQRVKTEEPDSQEKIDEDMKLEPAEYCRKKKLGTFLYGSAAQEKMFRDLMKRQRELDARK